MRKMSVRGLRTDFLPKEFSNFAVKIIGVIVRGGSFYCRLSAAELQWDETTSGR